MEKTFSSKEMLMMMMKKLDTIENKLNETHEMARMTNGKVKLHTKLIMGVFGALATIFTWFIKIILE